MEAGWEGSTPKILRVPIQYPSKSPLSFPHSTIFRSLPKTNINNHLIPLRMQFNRTKSGGNRCGK